MASPERIKKIRVFLSMERICDWEPVRKTMIQEKMSIMTVLTAVATVESVFLIPHFAKMEVRPAKMAEPNANKIHMRNPCFLYVILYSKYKYRISISLLKDI